MNLKSQKFHLHFGLEKPVRILQLTDVHLSLADDIDGDDMKERAAHRRDVFFREAEFPERDPVGYLEEAMEYSKEFDCTVITGDLIDFNSHANREMAKKILAGYDYLFCPGSHEFAPKVGIHDTFEYKREHWDEVQSPFRGDMEFESRIVGGVNLISMDNSYYLWTQRQFDLLKQEVAKGLPIVLFCHCAFDSPAILQTPGTNFKTLTRTKEEADFTISVNEYIFNEPLIKTAFSGHYHGMGGTASMGEKEGYVLAPLFKGIVGEITID